MRPALFAALLLFSASPGRAGDFASDVCLSTYKVYFPASTGTCILFSRQKAGESPGRQYLLATAAHVLEGITADEATLVLRKHLTSDEYQRADTPLKIRKDGKPLWTRHAKEDIAVLPLDLPADAPVTALDISSLATEQTLRELSLHVGGPLFSAVYPERREANDEGFPIVRQCTVASFPFLPVNTHHTFLVDAFAFHGDSGGPVFARDSRKGAESETAPPVIVGLVLAMWHTNEKTETPTETRTIHTGLGLATIVHAQFVREVIDLVKEP